MGTGAVVPYQLLPALGAQPVRSLPDRPQRHLRAPQARRGRDDGRAGLRRIANEVTLPTNYPSAVFAVQRPAEIVNYRSMGSTPVIIALGLTVGAVIALGLTLVASVRRRRRSMAMLRTLGFTGRQLAASVAWQSSVAVIIGLAIGVPLGILFGRLLWGLFADAIYVVPSPTVPPVPIVAIALGALVLGNLVAAVPGRIAARRRPRCCCGPSSAEPARGGVAARCGGALSAARLWRRAQSPRRTLPRRARKASAMLRQPMAAMAPTPSSSVVAAHPVVINDRSAPRRYVTGL